MAVALIVNGVLLRLLEVLRSDHEVHTVMLVVNQFVVIRFFMWTHEETAYFDLTFGEDEDIGRLDVTQPFTVPVYFRLGSCEDIEQVPQLRFLEVLLLGSSPCDLL